MNVFSLLRAGVVCFCLGGCAMAGIGTDPAPATYNINAPETRDAVSARWPVQLTVPAPTASRAIDTDRIMVTSASGRVSYFAGAAWSDRLPRLLQSRIVAALQDSGAFRAVLTAHDRADADYSLAIEVRSFHIEVGNGSNSAVVALYARMINEKRGNVLSAREFLARVPAGTDDTDSSVAALQNGFNKATADMVRWVATSRGRQTASTDAPR